ncbi:hypothetical protein M413DRAFT_448698 [Hebeloma cylindrosporum]|uniref:Uncharacterized protein n=1 Tax=Hebeloma cylindrosporum TaxID=76867 RepID=A0A0C3BYT9_HEBCY|nr:hypothetical protein M413DRAFT_448698 [Hebeloma cylindrosporum h7]
MTPSLLYKGIGHKSVLAFDARAPGVSSGVDVETWPLTLFVRLARSVKEVAIFLISAGVNSTGYYCAAENIPGSRGRRSSSRNFQ